MGPTWGPSGADRTQVGPMLAPWTLLSGTGYFSEFKIWFISYICCCHAVYKIVVLHDRLQLNLNGSWQFMIYAISCLCYPSEKVYMKCYDCIKRRDKYALQGFSRMCSCYNVMVSCDWGNERICIWLDLFPCHDPHHEYPPFEKYHVDYVLRSTAIPIQKSLIKFAIVEMT